MKLVISLVAAVLVAVVFKPNGLHLHAIFFYFILSLLFSGVLLLFYIIFNGINKATNNIIVMSNYYCFY